MDGRPSRYITIENEKYTRANPVSLCNNVKAAGKKAIAAAINCERVLEKSVSGRERYFGQCQCHKNFAKFCWLKIKRSQFDNGFCAFDPGMKWKNQ
jgi:hypothetical protein